MLPSDLGSTLVPEWQLPPHYKIFDQVALDLFTGKTKKILIQTPVRHSKSTYFSFLLPLLFILANPTKKLILSTYSGEFAAELSGRIRDAISMIGPSLCGVNLDQKYRRRNFIKTEQGGEIRGIGVGGRIAGTGADLLICDDLVKDIEEIANPKQRDKLFEYFNSELLTRLAPDAPVVVVMSRRHPDDIVGRLEKLNWPTIKFPAISDDCKALWPKRYSLQRLREIEKNLRDSGQGYLWDSLFQQQPVAWESCAFPSSYMPDFYTHEIIDQDLTLMAVDPATGVGKDYSVVSVCKYKDGQLFIDDCYRSNLCTNDELENRIVDFANVHKPQYIVVESVAFQRIITNHIAERLPWTSVVPYNPVKTAKEIRIKCHLSPVLATHRIHLRDTETNRAGREELQLFPSGHNDDWCDCLAIIVETLASLIGEKINTTEQFKVN